MVCGVSVGVFLAHGRDYRHYRGVLTTTSKPRPYKADHAPVIRWRPVVGATVAATCWPRLTSEVPRGTLRAPRGQLSHTVFGPYVPSAGYDVQDLVTRVEDVPNPQVVTAAHRSTDSLRMCPLITA